LTNAYPINSTVDFGFIQHSPGSNSDLMDLDFVTNYDRCLRCYAKSYPYGTAIGAASSYSGAVGSFFTTSATQANGFAPFPKRMAKTPTVTLYNATTGAVNSINNSGGISYAGSTATNIGDGGFLTVASSGLTAGQECYFHYTADTGW
jgi:hypothetical protein